VNDVECRPRHPWRTQRAGAEALEGTVSLSHSQTHQRQQPAEQQAQDDANPLEQEYPQGAMFFFIRGGTRNENACALKGRRAEERGEGSSGDEHFARDGRTGGEDTQVRGVKWAAGRWWQWIGKKMGAGGGVY
jgi:hypothetical protein